MKCCDITIGDLKRRITIQQQTKVRDGMGGYEDGWAQVAQPWAKISPKSGSEKLRADKLNADGLSTVIIRYRSDLNESMRVVYRGNNYQIRSIINIEEADRFLELTIERNRAQ